MVYSLPIKNCDFPWLCEITRGYIPEKHRFDGLFLRGFPTSVVKKPGGFRSNMDNRENSWHGSWCGSNMSECLDLSKGFGNVKSLHPFLKKSNLTSFYGKRTSLHKVLQGLHIPFLTLQSQDQSFTPMPWICWKSTTWGIGESKGTIAVR